jgi:hypothetical protein
MKNAFFLSILFASTSPLFSQDKIYKNDGTTILGKVLEISLQKIHLKRAAIPDGPVYILSTVDVDSIIYENGVVENIRKTIIFPQLKTNISYLNTWSFDVLGFMHFSISQSYERRFKKIKWLGIRVPLYLGYGESNATAGTGWYQRGLAYIVPPFDEPIFVFSVTTGIHPKFYLNNHRIIRISLSPEVLFSAAQMQYYNNTTYPHYGDTYITKWYGGFGSMGVFGVNINPMPRFCINLEGGVGYASSFRTNETTLGYGIWRVGVSLGTNF